MTNKARVYNIASIVCGTWFLFTSSVWVYLANLIISFPVGAAGIYLYYKGRQSDPASKLNRTALVIHILGVIASLTTLIVLLIYN
jgi:hypothetical protein